MTRTRIVIQSRLNSSRLPGKALLPICGIPLIELVARRASRGGHEVIVATSSEHLDSRIAEHLAGVGVASIRGALDDVLGRFVAATSDLAPEDSVVRLTGDNPVVDSDLVHELMAALAKSGLTYGRVDIARVPEGLGVEVFTVAALRLADAQAVTPYDREHVTPWIRREFPELLFVPEGCPPDPQRFRCTVDVLSDYDRALSLFAAQPDPIAASWKSLIAVIGHGLDPEAVPLPVRDSSGAGQSALVLDGHHLGRLYDSAPRGSKAPTIREILNSAVRLGVTHAATSRADADSERAIWAGSEPALKQRLRMILRLRPLATSDTDASALLATLGVESSLERSFAELGRRRADVVLADSVADTRAGNGSAWNRLQEYQQTGEVSRLGVFAANPAEVEEVSELPDLGFIALPMALGDPCWTDPSPAVKFLESGAVMVAVHSIVPTFALRSEHQQALHDLALDFKCEGLDHLCWAYALAAPWVTSVIAGIDTTAALTSTVRWASLAPLSLDQRLEVDQRLRALTS